MSLRRQDFTLEDEEGASTDMERGQLLSLSALSSDSLSPANPAAGGDIALQPVSKEAETRDQGSEAPH